MDAQLAEDSFSREDRSGFRLMVRMATMEQKIDGIAERIDAHAEQDHRIHSELTESIRRVHDRVDTFIPEVQRAFEQSLEKNAAAFSEKFTSLERTIRAVDEKADAGIQSIRKASWVGVWVVVSFLTTAIGAVIVFFLTYSRQIGNLMERIGA